ncbi:MAG: hypothetical protein ACP5O6_07260 [Candidatus Baltobacteraceae bacterium]
MDRKKELPLGIDLGASKLRMTYAVATSEGPRIEAVTSRERSDECSDDWIATMLDEMRADLGARTRLCSMALGSEESTIDAMTLPVLSYRERVAVANIEAQRRYPDGKSRLVRLFPTELPGKYALATADNAAVQKRKRIAARAGLRLSLLGIDGLVWKRFYAESTAVVDIGTSSTRIHTADGGIPKVRCYPVGGKAVTQEIARELSIDERSAEQRKRILGSAGSGERLIGALAAWIGERFEPSDLPHRERVLLVGNGSRLPEIRRLLAERIPQRAWLAACTEFERSRYPEDIRRAAFSDWALSIALASAGEHH